MMLCRKKLFYQNMELIGLVGGVGEARSFAHRVGCWKSILLSLEVFKSFVHFEVRNEARVFFLA